MHDGSMNNEAALRLMQKVDLKMKTAMAVQAAAKSNW